MMGGIDSQVSQRMDQFRGNPQGLMQQYQQNQQLIDLLALQKLKSEKEAAARDMQMKMQQNPQTIAQQREQEVQQMTQQEVAQQMGQSAPSVAQNMQQDQARSMVQQGIGGLPAPNVQGMARGGIVSFSGEDGSYVQRPARTAEVDQYSEDQKMSALTAMLQNGEPAHKVMQLAQTLSPESQQRLAVMAQERDMALPEQARQDREKPGNMETLGMLREGFESAGRNDFQPPSMPEGGVAELLGKGIRKSSDIALAPWKNAIGNANDSRQGAIDQGSKFLQGVFGGEVPPELPGPLNSLATMLQPGSGSDEPGQVEAATQAQTGTPPADIPAEYGGQGGASGILAAAQQGLPKGPDKAPAAPVSIEYIPDENENAPSGDSDRQIFQDMLRGTDTTVSNARDSEYERMKEIYGVGQETAPDERQRTIDRFIKTMLAGAGGSTNLGALTRGSAENMRIREGYQKEDQAFEELQRKNRAGAMGAAIEGTKDVGANQRSAVSALSGLMEREMYERARARGLPDDQAEMFGQRYSEMFKWMIENDPQMGQILRELDNERSPEKAAQIRAEIVNRVNERINLGTPQ